MVRALMVVPEHDDDFAFEGSHSDLQSRSDMQLC